MIKATPEAIVTKTMTALMQDDKEKKKKRPPQRGILTKIAFAMGAPLLFGVLGIIGYPTDAFMTLVARRNLGIAWNTGEFLVSYGVALFVFSLFSLFFYYFAIRSSRWFVVPLVVHIVVTILTIPQMFVALQNPRVLLSSVNMPNGEYQLFKDKQIGLGRGNIANALVIMKCTFVGDNCQQVWLVGDYTSEDRWGFNNFTMLASPDHEAALRITTSGSINCFDLDTNSLYPNSKNYFRRMLPHDCAILDPYADQ